MGLLICWTCSLVFFDFETLDFLDFGTLTIWDFVTFGLWNLWTLKCWGFSDCCVFVLLEMCNMQGFVGVVVFSNGLLDSATLSFVDCGASRLLDF